MCRPSEYLRDALAGAVSRSKLEIQGQCGSTYAMPHVYILGLSAVLSDFYNTGSLYTALRVDGRAHFFDSSYIDVFTFLPPLRDIFACNNVDDTICYFTELVDVCGARDVLSDNVLFNLAALCFPEVWSAEGVAIRDVDMYVKKVKTVLSLA